MEKMKRITFNDFDAGLIYEWRLALKQGLKRDGKEEDCCPHCKYIEKRLEKLLGSHAKWIKKQVAKHPYFN
jgi:hypothetical protein